MGKKVFKCDQKGCEKQFSSKFSLKRHYLIHKKDKPYVCDHCGKGFILQQYLEEHKYTHTGDKPFVCGVNGCTDSFRQRGKLSIHRKQVHKDGANLDRFNQYNGQDNEESKEDPQPYMAPLSNRNPFPQMNSLINEIEMPQMNPSSSILNYDNYLAPQPTREMNQNQGMMNYYQQQNSTNNISFSKPKLDWKEQLKKKEQQFFQPERNNPMPNQFLGIAQNRPYQNSSLERYQNSPHPEELSDESPYSGGAVRMKQNNIQNGQISNSIQQQQMNKSKFMNEKQKPQELYNMFNNSNKGNYMPMNNQPKFQDSNNINRQIPRNYQAESYGESNYDEQISPYFGANQSYQQMRNNHNTQRMLQDQLTQNYNQMRNEVPQNYYSQPNGGVNKRTEKQIEKKNNVLIRINQAQLNQQAEEEDSQYDSEGNSDEEEDNHYNDEEEEEQDSYQYGEESEEASQ